MIVEKANATRMVRTEEGKKLRKQYENHEIHHGFNEFKEPELRKDGCSNTLTSVQKDNTCVLLCVVEIPKIRQTEHREYIQSNAWK